MEIQEFNNIIAKAIEAEKNYDFDTAAFLFEDIETKFRDFISVFTERIKELVRYLKYRSIRECSFNIENFLNSLRDESNSNIDELIEDILRINDNVNNGPELIIKIKKLAINYIETFSNKIILLQKKKLIYYDNNVSNYCKRKIADGDNYPERKTKLDIGEIASTKSIQIGTYIDTGLNILILKKKLEKYILDIGIRLLFQQFSKDNINRVIKLVAGKYLLGKDIFLKKNEFIEYYREKIFPFIKGHKIINRERIYRVILKKDDLRISIKYFQFHLRLLFDYFFPDMTDGIEDLNKIFSRIIFPTKNNYKRLDFFSRLKRIYREFEHNKFNSATMKLNEARINNTRVYFNQIYKYFKDLASLLHKDMIDIFCYNTDNFSGQINKVSIDLGYQKNLTKKNISEIFTYIFDNLHNKNVLLQYADNIREPFIAFFLKLFVNLSDKDIFFEIMDLLIELIIKIDRFAGEEMIAFFSIHKDNTHFSSDFFSILDFNIERILNTEVSDESISDIFSILSDLNLEKSPDLYKKIISAFFYRLLMEKTMLFNIREEFYGLAVKGIADYASFSPYMSYKHDIRILSLTNYFDSLSSLLSIRTIKINDLVNFKNQYLKKLLTEILFAKEENEKYVEFHKEWEENLKKRDGDMKRDIEKFTRRMLLKIDILN